MTSAEVLTELARYFRTFEQMRDAIAERRFEMYRTGRALGSVAAAFDLLEELRRRSPDA